jgi:tetratricopeptide (TPR) repeat protein
VLEGAGDDAAVKKLQVWCLGNLAELSRQQGDYLAAEPLFQQALVAAEHSFGPNDLEVSAALNNLAVLYKYMGRFAEAGSLYQRALSITETALGPDHPDAATVYHNLGGLEHASGNYARGEPFARRAVEIRARALGADHPAVAADVAALAALLDGQGKYSESEPLYRRALAIFERVHGEVHDEIAVNLNNLAAVYYAQGKPEQSEPLYRRALAIKEKLLGSSHPDVAVTLNNLAVFCKSQGQYDQAVPLFQRALRILEKAFGSEHPQLATCLDNYARVLWKMGRTDDARDSRARADAIRSRVDRLSNDVAVTATINPQFACFPLSVRPSLIHRWGVFAERDIPAGHNVIEYTGERISRSEAARRSHRVLHYRFDLDEQFSLDGSVGGSGAEYINHSCDPNLYSCLVGDHVLYVSKRQIEPGEELTVDYRFSPDAPHIPCHCGASACRGTINVTSERAVSFAL